MLTFDIVQFASDFIHNPSLLMIIAVIVSAAILASNMSRLTRVFVVVVMFVLVGGTL